MRFRRGVLFIPLGMISIGWLLGCRRESTPATPLSPASSTSASRPATPLHNLPLPQEPNREERIRLLMESQRKRVLGRPESLEDIARVSDTVRPLVLEAVQQPTIQPLLQQMAQDQGIDLPTMQSRWVDMQEADLLLEAGGRPEAVSVSNAVGVAQWLASTAQGVGMRVELAKSHALTTQIEAKQFTLAWATYLSNPNAPRDSEGSPHWSPTEANSRIVNLKNEIESLKAMRREIDERYDPKRAIFAQTAYLLKLYARFPSPDWIFQAYHGGEGGVQKLLKLALGSRWNGNASDAIHNGSSGSPLSYESLYLDLDPVGQSLAMRYLFGRSDHHRYYWWKIRVAQEVLKAYRERRAELEQEWRDLFPGRSREVLWYPKAHENADPKRVAPLLPETEAVLRLMEQRYQQIGGKEPLTLFGRDLTADNRKQRQQAWLQSHPHKKREPSLPPLPTQPSVLPAGLPSLDFDYHGTGIVVDIVLPRSLSARALLEYALSTYADLGVLAYSLEKEGGGSHFHLFPNPRHTEALRALHTSQAH